MRLLILLLTLLPTASFAATTLIDGTPITTETVATGFDSPLYLTAPTGDPRLFVVEKIGRIRIIDKGNVLPTPFLDISARIATNSERGLLGLAFHPNYAGNGRLFIYFTDKNGNNNIAELHAHENAADAASLKILLTIRHPTNSNHNGGWLGFGPDGYLYASTGDGGGAGDVRKNAQNPDQLLGKLLRIDIDHGDPYAIPATNPFPTGKAPEIFALGLRNPWRPSFDGNTLYIADVGQDRWEEIDVIPATQTGANFGWNAVEGETCFAQIPCDDPAFVAPILTYNHDRGCSITGGYVYRGRAIPALQGRYFFSDYCTGDLMSLRYQDDEATDVTTAADDLGSLGQVTSFGQDGAGEIYIVTDDGKIAKLIAAP
ncbi:MAG: PQQ-dependent sugar dehydrogenase [Paracoccaceae bacterium]